ncbi:hypothetical protein BJ170DRAFT_484954 [Xylariales sp. AK1849]|nr:hypothetical protein BJ170DRAFT_484954 [Xylariales sp. AK1849]
MPLSKTITFESYSPSDPTPDWDTIGKRPVKAVWILRCEKFGPVESARGWRIAIEIDAVDSKGQIITLFPRAPSADCTIDVVCKPLCSAQDTAAKQDKLALFATGFHVARRVLPGTKVNDLLEEIHASGIENYQIIRGRGKCFKNNSISHHIPVVPILIHRVGIRFWLFLAMYQLSRYIVEIEYRSFDMLSEILLHHLRDSPAPFIDTDPDTSMKLRHRVLRAAPIPHKYSKLGYDNYVECRQRAIIVGMKQEFEAYGLE